MIDCPLFHQRSHVRLHNLNTDVMLADLQKLLAQVGADTGFDG